MTRVATPENQDYLLMIARHGTASHMERLVSGYRRAERGWEQMQCDDCYVRRELQWYQAEDGMLVVKARLTAQDGARFKAALDVVTQEMFDEGSADLSHETLFETT